MPYLDLQFTLRKGAIPLKTKVYARLCEILDDVIKRGIENLTEQGKFPKGWGPDPMVHFKSVHSRGSDLSIYLKDEDASIHELNSTETPIFSRPLHVVMKPPNDDTADGEASSEPQKKKLNYADVLFGRVALNLRFLAFEDDVDVDVEMDIAILNGIKAFYQEIGQ